MKKNAQMGLLCLAGILMLACSLTGISAEPTPAGPVDITLGPDGGGGYENLAEAVAGVPAGSAIRLEAGIYRLEQPLLIDKEISLIGSGMDLTKIISSAGDYVVRFDGAAPFRVYDITFSYEGTQLSDVVVVKSGEVLINNCRFVGARSSEEDEFYRAGLALLGETSGKVQNCEFLNNPYGIGTETSAADVLFEGNRLHHNTFAGIKYFSGSGGIARNNEVYENGLSGIILVGEAAPLLENNKLHHNTESGIVYFENSNGTARNNECFANGFNGISVTESARVVLDSNTCVENTDNGIRIAGNASATVKGNNCSRNGLHGILVREQAQAELVENTLEGNTEFGIAFFGSSKGTAQGNTSTGNGLHGLGTQDEPNVRVLDNVFSRNKEAGMRISDNSVVEIRGE